MNAIQSAANERECHSHCNIGKRACVTCTHELACYMQLHACVQGQFNSRPCRRHMLWVCHSPRMHSEECACGVHTPNRVIARVEVVARDASPVGLRRQRRTERSSWCHRHTGIRNSVWTTCCRSMSSEGDSRESEQHTPRRPTAHAMSHCRC
jgi:hypothetical protein